MKILVGLFLIFLASPFVLWFSEGARSAKDFSSAELLTNTDITQDGYIAIEGAPSDTTNLPCPEGIDYKQCLFLQTHVEEFVYSEGERCGSIPADVGIIERRPDKCEDGECEPCYLVETSDWDTIGDRKDYADFTLGAYTIKPSGSANIVGEQVYEVNYDNLDPYYGDQRTRYTYLPDEDLVLVAGPSTAGTIRGDMNKTLFISDLSYEATAIQLKAEDTATKWAGRIFSLILMMLGFVMVVSQFADPLTGTMRIIPVFGKSLQNASRSIIYAAAALLGLLAWIPVFIVIFLTRNLWVAIIVALVIAAFFIYKEKTGMKINVKMPGKKNIPGVK
jgi:hypothetical protein